uniref:Uncharacterized protein n=1 Tax=Clandestinovirus TaxID=2831644 RepID=A0A8F8KU70_9VIRU|nr:hypothetical protein KOM_12_440 [Clandestinovirus]
MSNQIAMRNLKNLTVKNADIFMSNGLIQSDTKYPVYYKWIDDNTLVCDGTMMGNEQSPMLPTVYDTEAPLQTVYCQDSNIHIYDSVFVSTSLHITMKGKCDMTIPKREYSTINHIVAGTGSLHANDSIVETFSTCVTGSSSVERCCFRKNIVVAVVGLLRLTGVKSKKCNVTKNVVGDLQDCLINKGVV